MKTITFEVLGKPQPKGSKRSFPIMNRKTGFPILGKGGRPIINTVEDNPNAGKWMQAVAYAFKVENGKKNDARLFEGALRLEVVFYLLRPQGHLTKSGKLSSSWKPFPTVKPDITKLVRGIEDALNGVAWRDDSQIVDQKVSKRYGPELKAVVTIAEIDEPA